MTLSERIVLLVARLSCVNYIIVINVYFQILLHPSKQIKRAFEANESHDFVSPNLYGPRTLVQDCGGAN